MFTLFFLNPTVVTVQHSKISRKKAKGCRGEENEDFRRKKKKIVIHLKVIADCRLFWLAVGFSFTIAKHVYRYNTVASSRNQD